MKFAPRLRCRGLDLGGCCDDGPLELMGFLMSMPPNTRSDDFRLPCATMVTLGKAEEFRDESGKSFDKVKVLKVVVEMLEKQEITAPCPFFEHEDLVRAVALMTECL